MQVEGGKVEAVADFIFLGSKITVDSDCNHEIKRHWILGSNTMTNLDSVLKSKDITANKCPYSQSYDFSSSYVWMWELDPKGCWVLNNWCFCIEVLKETLESPLDCKEIKPINPKGNRPWIFTGKTDAEAEVPILWSPDVKSWLTGKDPHIEKDWRQKEKRVTKDEMVRKHHRLNGHEYEQTQEERGEWRGLACCRPWSLKEWDTT